MGRLRLLLFLPLLLLGGCQAAPAATTAETTPEQTQEPPEQQPLEKSTEPEPGESESQPADGPVPCPEAVLVEIQDVISSQTGAFGEGDYELAYSFSSVSFQASVNLEQFVQIIEGSYGPLISSSSLVFSNCLTNTSATAALLDARFIQTNNEVYALRYLVSRSDDGWKVEGASNLAVVGEGA